ncbi:Protein FAM49A [Hondaea fermentalgiana]|uniref:Protein FAM49A n=1 Tax=Hondaea fermentalgiana TaxID=2315210 RepID=A0A2R5G7E3_9STRA|nr:Protein FAM49A [Hondaea fermentalgiana]|eukprot:GBG26249.1 Protein FAM49A [Hondaea fermentalgiana]
MGALLAKFTGTGGRDLLELREAAPPQASEPEALAAYQRAEAALEHAEFSLEFLRAYKANDKLVQQALGSPNDPKVRQEAFEGMFPNVEGIRGFYELSSEINSAVGDILRLVAPVAMRGGTPLSSEQALVAKLAALFEVIFLFDWAKMSQPAVQNDFSFYRRELSKNMNNPNVPVDDSMASAISMFVAQGSPLLTALANDLSLLSKQYRELVPYLADFSNLAAQSAPQYSNKGSFPDSDGLQTLLLSSVVAAVLYDKIDVIGAFTKSSPVSMKRVVQGVRQWDSEFSNAALSTLQYSSRNFSSAPSSVRKLFP